MTATTPTRTTPGTSAAAILATLASTEGPVTIHERVLTFEDGTTIDLTPWAGEVAPPTARQRFIIELARDEYATDPDVRFDDDAEVSESEADDPFCHVQGWVRFRSEHGDCQIQRWISISTKDTALDPRAVDEATEFLQEAGYEPINDNSFFLERNGEAVDPTTLSEQLQAAWDVVSTSWEIAR